jgi:hypothetical protein
VELISYHSPRLDIEPCGHRLSTVNRVGREPLFNLPETILP